MLTDKEKIEVERILRSLDPDQLKSLAGTVTNGQIACRSDEDCRKAILSFENSTEDFLRRKVILKKMLVQYAYEEQLPLVGDYRKEDLVRLISKHWSGDYTQITRHGANPESSYSSGAVNFNHHASTNVVNFYQTNVLVQTGPTPLPAAANNAGQSEDYLFGETFCNWFYKMLNHCDPESQGFGSSHFMPAAKMFTLFVSPGNVAENCYSDSVSISNCLLELSRTFTFNPNVSCDGLKVKSDPHGLKLVLICGTLFKDSSLTGTFQQSFGMVKDPNASGNWKIQVTAMKCSEAHGHVIPQLDEQSASDLERLAVDSLKHSLVKV